MDFSKRALDLAQKSPCKKRKVGAIIVDRKGYTLGEGWNRPTSTTGCEDANGDTFPDVVHAEIAALEYFNIVRKTRVYTDELTMYVTHQPCENCAKAIAEAGITDVRIVKEFMKFDTGKLRYSLIPPEMTKALAEVLTYGAKKYKPNNWQKVDDPSRYMDAMFRHIEAFRNGETHDPESGLHHLAHTMANVGFLLWIDLNNKLDDKKS